MSASSKFAAKHTTVSAANQAALKALKVTKAKVHAATAPANDEPIVDPVVDEAMRSYAAAQDDLAAAFKVPSGTRFLLAACSGILAYASTLWFGMPLLEWAIVGAVSLTGSAFLGWLVYVFGLVILVVSSVVAGVKAYSFITNFDVQRAADVGRGVREAAKSRVSQVRGWFKRSDPALATA